MADPQPADQGFLPGLLGNVGGWFGSYDPQAAYGGLLSDPATKRAFQVRELGAAAQAMAQASMPVPYKGGMPWGSFLGSAGGAAATAGDSLIKARLEQAQSEQAVQDAAALHAKQLATTEILKNYQDPNSIYNRGGGTGTGTGTDGKPLTGPAKIIAAGGGGGSASADPNVMKGVLNTAQQRQLTPAATTALVTVGLGEGGFDQPWAPSGIAGETSMGPWQFNSGSHLPAYLEKNKPGDVPAMTNYTIDAIEKDRAAKGLTPFASITDPAEAIGAVAAFENSALYRRNPAAAIQSYSSHLPAATALIAQHSGASPQTASTGDQPAAAPGSQVGPYAPVPGQPGPQGVYVPPGASPYSPPVRIEGGPPPAAPPGGLLKLPDPTSAAPPQLATPPATGAPGPAAAAASPTLGLLAAQQGGGDVGSPLGAATPQIAGIPSRGLLAQVAGPGAADPSASPAAVTQQSQLPHTGAAGAAELAGLLAQQPAAAPPTATPYINAPPANGQGAPAPGPAPGPVPPAPPPAPGGAAPPMPQPVMPSAIPGAPSAQDVRDANRAVILHGIAGIPLPPNIAEIAKFPMVGPTAQATAAGTAAGQQPYQLQQAANKAMWDIYVAQQKPRDPQREGTFAFNPQTGQYTLNRSMIEADGSTHQHISILDQNLKPLSDYDAGAIKAAPGPVAAQTAAGTEAGKYAPAMDVPGAPQTGRPGFVPLPNAPPPDQKIQSSRGTFIPGTDRQNLPTRWPDYAAVQTGDDGWNSWKHDMVTAQTMGGQAEAQIGMIIQAVKQNEMGSGTEARASLGNFLISNLHVDPKWVNQNITNVGAVQTMLYAQARDTLTTLAAVNKRFTGGEFKITSQTGTSPEQLNVANLPILAQDLAKVRQIQGVAENWQQAQRTTYADGSKWTNPQDFVSAWYEMNPLAKLQAQTLQQIGSLPGAPLPGVPENAKPTGRTIGGWPEFEVPNPTGGPPQRGTFPGQWKGR